MNKTLLFFKCFVQQRLCRSVLRSVGRRLLDGVQACLPSSSLQGASGVATLQFQSGPHTPTTVVLAPMSVVRVSPADLYKCFRTVSQLPESVIWVKCWGWGRSRSSSVTGRGWRRTWGTSWGCTSPRCAVSIAAPHSPWTVSC